MSYIAELKGRVIALEEENDRLQSLVDSFFTGNVPNGAGPDHFVIARWGRKRLEDMKARAPVPALLRSA